MTLRFRLVLALGALALSGCTDSFNAGPITYTPNAKLADLKAEDGKPKAELQRRVITAMNETFGPSPQEMIVPKGAGLPEGGARLADRAIRVNIDKEAGPVGFNLVDAKGAKTEVLLEGGYGLYRKHCLHCHGVSGDGNGPTADFLWPRPRDYRKGLFKFTSTNSNQKPTRKDLERILIQGIANSSMPSFESLMSPVEIQQVVDYLIFLSARGETEARLIGEAEFEDEPKDDKAPSEIAKPKAEEIAATVFDFWKTADAEVMNPPVPRTPSTRESIENGKKLFLGQGAVKVECAGCHGPKAQGNGPSFVPYAMFREVVFGGDPELQSQRLGEFIEQEGERAVEDAHPTLSKIQGPAERLKATEKVKADRMAATKLLWTGGSLDDWGNPLRPGNLNNGMLTMYKGGRRPIDIYWRIAKGINGAKMPGHYPQLKPEQIWDLVNFVLTLPAHPELLDDAPETVAPATSPATPAATASK